MKTKRNHRRLKDGTLDINDQKPWRVDDEARKLATWARDNNHNVLALNQELRGLGLKSNENYDQSEDDILIYFLRGIASATEKQWRSSYKTEIKINKQVIMRKLRTAKKALERIIEIEPKSFFSASHPHVSKYKGEYGEYITISMCNYDDYKIIEMSKIAIDRIILENTKRINRATLQNNYNKMNIITYINGMTMPIISIEYPKIKMIDLYCAIWMDAGLPILNKARSGQSESAWLRKLLKNNMIDCIDGIIF